MKPGILFINLYFLMAGSAFASTTVDSEFVITNRKIESANFKSTDNTATFTDTTGNGLYLIHDNFTDANIDNIMKYGNQQLGFRRTNSLIEITMTGKKLGHSFPVYAKYANSSFRLINVQGSAGYFQTYSNNGCSEIEPRYGTLNGTKVVYFSITAGNNMATNCSGTTEDIRFNASDRLYTEGISRDFYLDMGRLQNDKSYRDAPPDIYTGVNTYYGEKIQNRVGDGYPVVYINKITITKNPYFENVTLPPGDNVFNVRTVGGDIHGNLVIPYVINGYFTPYNNITLSVTSLNGFKLKNADFNEIPYSLTTDIDSQREYSLVTSGVNNGAVTISNLTSERHALQGRFNANFSVNKSVAKSGEYSDTLTVIFQITL